MLRFAWVVDARGKPRRRKTEATKTTEKRRMLVPTPNSCHLDRYICTPHVRQAPVDSRVSVEPPAGKIAFLAPSGLLRSSLQVNRVTPCSKLRIRLSVLIKDGQQPDQRLIEMVFLLAPGQHHLVLRVIVIHRGKKAQRENPC